MNTWNEIYVKLMNSNHESKGRVNSVVVSLEEAQQIQKELIEFIESIAKSQ